MVKSRKGAAGAAAAALAVATGGAAWLLSGADVQAQAGSAPVARYEMRAETVSGMGAMAGGRGGMGAAMSMAFGGGGGGVLHRLELALGSSRAPADGAPHADHFVPAGMNMGPSLALKTPSVAPRETSGEMHFERPKGRMLIFWGCGEHAGPGQPVVIDFASLAAGQTPPGLFTSRVPSERWVTPASSRTYGYWPADDGKAVKADSALPGPHRVAGNYSPEMAFTLAHDFMGALHATGAAQPSGAMALSWNALADATGYYAFAMGGKDMGRGKGGDIVWWSSASTREFGGGLADYLAPATVARLVSAGTVLAPQRTTCTVPAEVKQAGGQFMMTSLFAYGPMESFAYPARPANPRLPWRPEWTARILHRAMTMIVPGMPEMGEAGDGQRQKPPCKRKRGLGGLGGALGSVLGGALPGGGGNGC